MDQEIVDKVKALSYKQDVIRKIGFALALLIGCLIMPLIMALFNIIPIVMIFVILGIIEFFIILWYIYGTYLWQMRMELAGWGCNADNSNPQFEISFNDGNYYTKDLVEAFQMYPKKIISVKKTDKS